MSEATPPRSAAPKTSAGVAIAVSLWLAVLVAQWQVPALPEAAAIAVATLIILALGLLLLRQTRRETALDDRLRQQIARRDAAESALRQTRNLAAIGRLTRGLAHDFNNHLTAVSSNIELLARRLPPESGTLPRLAASAIDGVRRAALLTHQLLSLSRNQGAEPEPLDLGRLVAGLAVLLQRTLGETIRIESTLAEGLWLAWADASQVEWALLDLALNARDSMPDGGTLRIETRNAAGEAGLADWVMLAVSHTGAETADNPAPGAAEAVDGGRVRVTEEPGRGSTVRLYLPRHVVQTPARPVSGAAPHCAGTILLVEDDDGVRDAAAHALRDLGYEVLEAPDAMEGFRLVADRGGIDLLFTDIGLPGGVDGRTLADAARNVMPELKVLFTTGYARSDHMIGKDSGTLFLAKPFSLDELAAKVREALSQQSPAPELALGEN